MRRQAHQGSVRLAGLQQSGTPHLVGVKPTWTVPGNKHLQLTGAGAGRGQQGVGSRSPRADADGKTTLTQQQRGLMQLMWTNSLGLGPTLWHPPHSTGEVPDALEGSNLLQARADPG